MTASTLPRWADDSEPAFILQLAQALAPHYDVTVLAPHYPGARRDEDITGVRVHRYRYAPQSWQLLAYEGGMLRKLREKPLRWLLVPSFVLGQMLAIWRLNRDRRFDLVHAHWIVPQGLAAALLKRIGLLRIPTLLTSHGGDLFALGRASRVKRWILSQMEDISVVSEAMVPVCESLGVSPERILVRSMGVDLRQRFNSVEPFEQRRGLVFVGRLVEKKGVDTLLRAFALVLEDHPEERLTIVGGGHLRDPLERLAAELGCVGAVDFIGSIANERVPPYLNRARISVVPSVVASDGDQEGLGLVAVEAMGCGCAVVCSDLPALRDVVTDGETGLVYTAGDAESLATALLRLLDDPDLAARLATAGRTAVNLRFDWSSVADDYAARYRRLL